MLFPQKFREEYDICSSKDEFLNTLAKLIEQRKGLSPSELKKLNAMQEKVFGSVKDKLNQNKSIDFEDFRDSLAKSLVKENPQKYADVFKEIPVQGCDSSADIKVSLTGSNDIEGSLSDSVDMDVLSEDSANSSGMESNENLQSTCNIVKALQEELEDVGTNRENSGRNLTVDINKLGNPEKKPELSLNTGEKSDAKEETLNKQEKESLEISFTNLENEKKSQIIAFCDDGKHFKKDIQKYENQLKEVNRSKIGGYRYSGNVDCKKTI